MNHFPWRRPRARRGSNAVEFALTLPVILVILSGTVDYGYYLHLQYHMVNAVSQAARAGAVTPANQEPKDVAKQMVSDLWVAANLPGTPDTTGTDYVDAPPDKLLQVVGTLNYKNMAMVGFIPVPEQVAHTAVMRLEDQN